MALVPFRTRLGNNPGSLHSFDHHPGFTEEDDRRAIQWALARLSDQERRLALLLFSEPSPSYLQVSARLSMPLGTIGPTRGRILKKLRRILIDHESELALAG